MIVLYIQSVFYISDSSERKRKGRRITFDSDILNIF